MFGVFGVGAENKTKNANGDHGGHFVVVFTGREEMMAGPTSCSSSVRVQRRSVQKGPRSSSWVNPAALQFPESWFWKKRLPSKFKGPQFTGLWTLRPLRSKHSPRAKRHQTRHVLVVSEERKSLFINKSKLVLPCP